MGTEKDNSEPSKDELDILKEEWKLVQSIIDRHANMAFKIRTWFLTLLTAIIIGTLSEKIELSTLHYLAASFLIMATFLTMELQQRIFLIQAMDRASQIEGMMRQELKFNSPRLSESFTMKHTWSSFYRVASKSIVLIPYGCFTILILLTALALEYT